MFGTNGEHDPSSCRNATVVNTKYVNIRGRFSRHVTDATIAGNCARGSGRQAVGCDEEIADSDEQRALRGDVL